MRSGRTAFLWALLWAPACLAGPDAPQGRRILDTPSDVAQFLAIEQTLQDVLPAAMRSVVCLQSETGSGTGVLVGGDGLIYTAAHVVLSDSGEEKGIKAIFADGGEHPVEVVAADEASDAAIVRITDGAACPHVTAAEHPPETGEWVFALGHANGYDDKRGVVVRLGRIVSVRQGVYKSDCKLIGGDSGGPLLNLKGELVGIHSRVGADLEHNIHVPLPAFRTLQKPAPES